MADYHDHADSGAPGRLELVRQFVNTCDIETGAEALTGPRELSEWIEAAGLADRVEASTADLERAIELRESLRMLLMENNGYEPDPAVQERLNSALAGCTLEVRFEESGSSLVPSGHGVDAALATIASIIRDAMQRGDWARMKVCPADDCRWAFYDRSRNRSRTWCQMEACGNRSKVRAFRERKSSGSLERG